MLNPESFIKQSKDIEFSGHTTTSISTSLYQAAVQMVQDLYTQFDEHDTFKLPIKPIALFSKEQIEAIQNHQKRIFYSYFSNDDADLVLPFVTPGDGKEDFIFSLYCLKKGKDRAVRSIVAKDPCFHLFTHKEVFDAIYRPHKKSNFDFVDVEFHDRQAICDMGGGATLGMDCFDLLEELHGSPKLSTITDYISNNPHIFYE
jgi:hypothetical protein